MERVEGVEKILAEGTGDESALAIVQRQQGEARCHTRNISPCNDAST